MATTTPTTVTFTHGCGHQWVWQFAADYTPAEIRRTRREYYRQCPDCKPVAGMHDTRYETRPLHRVESTTPVVTVTPAPAPVAVAPAQPTIRLATTKQLDYLARLGVEVPQARRLTIEEASAAIDEARRGGSLGWLGLTYQDGSN